jgi:hypothetical protein
MLDKMTNEMSIYCTKKHIRLIVELKDIVIKSDKNLVTHLMLNLLIMIMKMVPKNSAIRMIFAKTTQKEGLWDFIEGEGNIDIISISMGWVHDEGDE